VTAQPDSPALVTVVVVDDSATQRRFVRTAVAGHAGLEIVGEARNGRDAVALVERLRPTAVLMDLHLPVMNGLEAIERIMATRPTPIIVYSSFVDGDDHMNAASALAAGAIDVMAKPGPEDSSRLEEYAEALRRRLRVAGRVKVITHPRGRLAVTSTTSSMSTHRLTPLGAAGQALKPRAGSEQPPAARCDWLDTLTPRTIDLLAIGASTGGPQALARLLAELPETTTTAILVVQHMADGFMEGLASWLDGLCPLPVVVGVHGKRLPRGTVTVAPSGANFVIHEQLRATAHVPPPGQYHVPGIDATFTSVANAFGSSAAGVLLTGMGRDGAAGLKKIRNRGGITIGQDESTSAVYGMPAAALALDAVDVQLTLSEIGAALRSLVSNADDGATP
jgi:two-component system, chemotaxis family, protein-glutamate methylesterase/glutaminase